MFVSCVSISGRRVLKILESVHAVKGMIGMKKKRKKGGSDFDMFIRKKDENVSLFK